MASDPVGKPALLTPEQERYRGEWRNLCYSVERVQADDLIAKCHDKYQCAKTYMVYGSRLHEIIAEVQVKADHGNYTFFAERGVPAEAMSPALAQRMLRDWAGAIASKRTRVAEIFQYRFGEEIDVFVATPRNAQHLATVESLDEADGILQLARWVRN